MLGFRIRIKCLGLSLVFRDFGLGVRVSWVALGPFTGIGCRYHSDFETVWSHYTGESTTQVNLSCCNATSLVRVVHARNLIRDDPLRTNIRKIAACSASCQDYVELRMLLWLSWACGKGLWGPVSYFRGFNHRDPFYHFRQSVDASG